MSTRSQIKIICSNRWRNQKTKKIETYKDEVLLYRHWDGYPESIIPFLKDFFRIARFGYDTHLNNAEQISHALIIYGYKVGVRVEPSAKIHRDIEYYYEVVVSNSKIELKIYKVSFDDFRKKNLIKTMKIGFNRMKRKEYDAYEWGLPIHLRKQKIDWDNVKIKIVRADMKNPNSLNSCSSLNKKNVGKDSKREGQQGQNQD